MRNLTQNQYAAKRRRSRKRISPPQTFEEFHFLQTIRHKHSKDHGKKNNHELPHGPVKRKPGKYQETDAQKHAHVIDKQTVGPRIHHSGHNNNSKQQKLYDPVKKQIFQIPAFKTNR